MPAVELISQVQTESISEDSFGHQLTPQCLGCGAVMRRGFEEYGITKVFCPECLHTEYAKQS